MKRIVLLCGLLITAITDAVAQVPTCSPDVPYYTVDFTGNPSGTWISPGHSRFGNCCGTVFPDRCTSFDVICDSNTAMIEFEIASGAVPQGSMFYQINCGPMIPVGDPICVSGPNPHHLTFCKPGNNQNTYRITSISKPVFPKDDTTRIGCSLPIPTLGLEETTVFWNSIFPGSPGQYNSYLNCTTNCDTALYTPAADAPPYVEYQICGTPIATQCGFIFACDTVRIYNMQPLSGTSSPNPGGFCQGGSGVTITATASGGFGPYSFTWRNQSLEQVCSNSSCLLPDAGIYSIEIRDVLYDSTYCPAAFATATVIVTAPPIVNAGADQTLCAASPIAVLNGSVENAPGGIWSGGEGTFNPGPTSLLVSYTPSSAELAAGEVTLKLKSTGIGGGCDNDSDFVTLHYPPILVVAVPNVSVNCFGESATLNATVTGGVGPFTFEWNTGQTSSSITSGAGTYCVLVTDALGCIANDCGTISEPAQLYISMSATPATMNGGSDGTATANVTGGTPPYSYLWSTGGTTQTITDLSYGTYTVTATDANGCTIYSSVVVNEPQCNGFYASGIGTDVSCFGENDGTATAIPVNGTAPFTFAWSSTDQVTATVTGLSSGEHQCVVTDAVGCMATVNISITQPTVLSNTMTHSDVSTVGGSDGSASTNVSGGTPPYIYLWNTGATSSAISGLSAGSYSVLITDANGCSITGNVQIDQPSCSNYVAGVVSTNVSCSGAANGTAQVIVINGVNPISILWSTGSTASSISGLAAGSYSVIVTDAINCSATVYFTITEPSPLSIALAPTDITCADQNNGTIELSVTGGTFPYTYEWSNGLPTEDLINLSNGSYSVIVTDANGCTASGSASIDRPAPILVSTVVTPVTCNNGSDGAVDASVSGGISPYVYSWSNGATTQDISGLESGAYVLTVTDANYCIATALSALVDEPDTIKITGAVAECPDPATGISQVTLSASGGNPGDYQVSVDGGVSFLPPGVNMVDLPAGGTYIITVRDESGCSAPVPFTLVIAPPVEISAVAFASCTPDGAATVPVTVTVTGGSGGTIQVSFDNGVTWQAPGDYTADLVPGATYNIVARDSAGCVSATATISIATEIALEGVPSVYAGGYNISCAGGSNGSIDLSAEGGTGSLAYSWSNGATTQDISGVPAGQYSVVVTDGAGCSDSIGFLLTEPVPLTGLIVSVNDFNGYDISCSGSMDGEIGLAIAGGVAPYTYNWLNGSTSQNISNLGPGLYSVAVTDQNGCTFSTSIVLSEPSPIVNTAMIFNIPCNGFATGLINVTTAGGVYPYTYNWSNGAQTQDIYDLVAGVYTVITTDANGCSRSDVFVVTESAPLTISAQQSNLLCTDDGNGSIDITVDGGTRPYNYFWSNGSISEDLFNLSAGTYIITVIDAYNCFAMDTFYLTDPLDLIVNANSPVNAAGHNISHYGAADGSIDLTVEGGTPPYTYQWSNGATTEDLSGLAAGTYSVIVTDANGCTATDAVTLTAPLILEMPTGFSPNGDGHNDFFEVHGIEAYPNNHIEVYNRWGQLVWDADNYANKWNGNNESGDELPDATYFVILNINDGEIILKGYVDIRRR